MAPVFDWDTIPDTQDFTPAPEGWYPCECVEASTQVTGNGGEHFLIFWKILEGEERGKRIRDRIFYHTEKAQQRLKVVLKKLGFELKGTLAIEPEHLKGRRALVETVHEKWTGEDGRERVSNAVSYAGYAELAEGAGGVDASGGGGSSAPSSPVTDPDDGLPF